MAQPSDFFSRKTSSRRLVLQPLAIKQNDLELQIWMAIKRNATGGRGTQGVHLAYRWRRARRADRSFVCCLPMPDGLQQATMFENNNLSNSVFILCPLSAQRLQMRIAAMM